MKHANVSTSMGVSDVDAIVFDAVGTLIFPEPAAAVVYFQVGRRFGSQHHVEEIGARFRAAFAREEAADLAGGLRTSETREVERWRNIVAAVLEDVTDPQACFQALYQHFAEPAAWRCGPEVAAVLGTLQERGFRLAMASNYDRRLRSVVAGLPGLEPVRVHLAISSQITWRKPAAEFFAALARMLACRPERTLFIGDDLDNDFHGARAAGMQARLFDPEGRLPLHRDERIERLAELLEKPWQA